MKHKPILFSTMMVQALLAGRKTMTRREIKDPELIAFLNQLEKNFNKKDLPDTLKRVVTDKRIGTDNHEVPCKIGQIGDLLWVREAFWKDYDPLTQAYNELTPGIDFGGYRADHEHGLTDDSRCLPGMFLPKNYARIWLGITDIKIERLKNISEVDAIAEGIEQVIQGFFREYTGAGMSSTSPIRSFRQLWQSINGEETWDSNPWVWAITFKVLSTNGLPETNVEEAFTP